MTPIDIFIETSSLPRGVGHMSPELERLIELTEVNLVRIHMSEVTFREWESQMVDDLMQVVDDVSRAVKKLLRRKLSSELSFHTQLQKMASSQDEMRLDTDQVVRKRVKEVIEKLGTNIVPIDPEDGSEIMGRRYFSGDPPFRQAKFRDDIPDAFIFKAAERIAKQLNRKMQVVCQDGVLKEALSQLSVVSVHKDLKGLLSCEEIVAVSKHLPLAQYWTEPKQKDILSFIASEQKPLLNRIQNWAENELYSEIISDHTIPSDGNEAFIHGVGEVENLTVDWDKAEDMEAGWILVPFEFSCELQLDFMVYGPNSFSVDDWVSISFPRDFESSSYFEASGYRVGIVSGWISLRFTLDDLQQETGVLPEIEVEDTEVRLTDLEYVQHYFD